MRRKAAPYEPRQLLKNAEFPYSVYMSDFGSILLPEDAGFQNLTALKTARIYSSAIISTRAVPFIPSALAAA